MNSSAIVLGQQPNPVLWTLACAWRDRILPYTLHGPALITGRAYLSGTYLPLTGQMATQTQAALKAAAGWWLEHDYDIPLWPVNTLAARPAPPLAPRGLLPVPLRRPPLLAAAVRSCGAGRGLCGEGTRLRVLPAAASECGHRPREK
ncbi:hypothetical protein OG413_41475 [Streptomyces sp. NBC_01433]|uniref:hypothetical protein n=1 Tax=Streptomyces sp. NBC_01433 TaxID=2903864 RepID=UPI00224E7447|nr:hypothetical protein [Streptomyces sp. NBC_01433]MCX4681675.1 hypothetical protein [Streptomyces sp. NBC_01433]